MQIFTDHEAAQLATAETELTMAMAAAACTQRGMACVDQWFDDEIIVLAPKHVSAPPLLLIGGMGPQVGLRAFAQACARFAQSRQIVLVQACSIPDRTLAGRAELCNETGTGSASARLAVTQALSAAIQKGWRAIENPVTANLLVLCNTAHHFLTDIALPPQLQLIDLIDAAARRCQGMSEVIVLSTFGTRAAGLYARSLARWHVHSLTPPEEAEALLMDAVYRGVKAMNQDHAVTILATLLQRLAQWAPHADGLICGCTEIPLILPLLRHLHLPWPLIDPLTCAMDGVQHALADPLNA